MTTRIPLDVEYADIWRMSLLFLLKDKSLVGGKLKDDQIEILFPLVSSYSELSQINHDMSNGNL